MDSARAIFRTGGFPCRLRAKFSNTIHTWPTTNAKLVRTRNFVKSRRATNSSCGQSIGKSFRHCGWSWYGRPSGGTESWSDVDVIVDSVKRIHSADRLVVHRREDVDEL